MAKIDATVVRADTIIACRTQDEYVRVTEKLIKLNYTWSSGSSLILAFATDRRPLYYFVFSEYKAVRFSHKLRAEDSDRIPILTGDEFVEYGDLKADCREAVSDTCLRVDI